MIKKSKNRSSKKTSLKRKSPPRNSFRRRKSPARNSVRRRKSPSRNSVRRRKSPLRNKSLYRFDEVCMPHMKEMSDKDLEYIVQALLKFDDERKEIAKRNLGKNVALSFHRHRGEYSRRNMRRLYDLSMSAARVTGRYAGYALDGTRAIASRVLNTSRNVSRMLYNSLRTQVSNVDNQRLVFSMVDLGYRHPGYADNHRLTFLTNAAMYGFLFFQDWQYMLLTPMYGNMLMNIINNNDQESLFQLFIFLNGLSINGGVNPSEILLRIQDSGIQICNMLRLEAINSLIVRYGINKLLRMGQEQLHNILLADMRRL